MRNFWALPAVLQVSLVIAAQNHPFSVNEDLLAYPQYEVRWSEDYIEEEAARERIRSIRAKDTSIENESRGHSASSHVDRYRPPIPSDGAESAEQQESEIEYTYEMMTLDGQKYFCSIPLISVKDEDPSTTINDTLAKIEEEKELTRANERGWELMSGMQGHCVYYVASWWSYKFCYNQGVKQFHQLPPSRGVPVYPPIEDPGVPGFMLGSFKEIASTAAGQAVETNSDITRSSSPAQPPGELVAKGESRYLVQRLDDGSTCDLTGKPRKIEVQFHCNPSTGVDRISLIKEVSTCSYLMVVQTPRLCNDVAFQPLQKDEPNEIMCQPVLKPDDVDQYVEDLATIKEALKLAEEQLEEMEDETPAIQQQAVHVVGDIRVGAHKIVPERLKLEKSAIVGGGKETIIDTIASSEGRMMTKAELEKLGLGEAKGVEELTKRLEKQASGRQWKLIAVDTPTGREYRGVIGEEDEPEQDDSNTNENKDESTKDDAGDRGSEEEYYKEEL